MRVLDETHELSIEQLISALNKKLLVECTQVQAAVSPMSRIPVGKIAGEVRVQNSTKGGLTY